MEHLERLNMVRYNPGEFYGVHHDGPMRPVTVFIYLNDLPDGAQGETYFPKLGLKFVPRKGTALMWSNVFCAQRQPNPNLFGKQTGGDPRMVHEGLPPSSGLKFGLNAFFNQLSK